MNHLPVNMVKIIFSCLALLTLIACGQKQTFKDVSAPVKKETVVFTDTLPVTLATTDIPHDPLILSTSDTKAKIDQAMNGVLKRLKGTISYQPEKPPGDEARNVGGPFHMESRVKKLTYVTGLSGTGTFSNEDIFIGVEVVSFDFIGSDPLSPNEGRTVSVRFPDGKRQLKIEGVSAVVNGKPSFAYHCQIGVKVFGMLEDGTYAAERTTITGTVAIPNDFEMELHVK